MVLSVGLREYKSSTRVQSVWRPWTTRKEPGDRIRSASRTRARAAAAPEPAGAYVPAKISRRLIFASGQTPTVEGEPVYRGKVGDEVNEDDAYAAARLATLTCLAELHYVLGDLGRVREIVKVTGYIASASGFGQQARVVNGASELLQELWGESGHHARPAIGVAELPFGGPVEIELIAEVDE